MRPWMLIFMALLLAACQTPPPIQVQDNLDLDRFMGDWYVIANIPLPTEGNDYNELEQYRRAGPRKVAITFSYNDGGCDGERASKTPVGFVSEDNNSIWGVQFLWPFKADYRVLYVSPDYRTTIIGRRKRDYLWIMARSRHLDAATLTRLERIAARHGYDVSKIRHHIQCGTGS